MVIQLNVYLYSVDGYLPATSSTIAERIKMLFDAAKLGLIVKIEFMHK